MSSANMFSLSTPTWNNLGSCSHTVEWYQQVCPRDRTVLVQPSVCVCVCVCVCVWPSVCGQWMRQECESGMSQRGGAFWWPTNGWQKRFCPPGWQRQAWRQSSLFKPGRDEMSLVTAQTTGLASSSLNVIWRESYCSTLTATWRVYNDSVENNSCITYRPIESSASH